MVLGDEPEFGDAPGWWLEGRVRGQDGPLRTTASIRVSHSRSPTVVTGTSTAEGTIELDVGAILRDPDHQIDRLLVEVDHPNFLPAARVVALDRRLRQIGFRSRRGRIAADFSLIPARHRLTGQVTVPVGFSKKGMMVVSVAPHPAGRPSRSFESPWCRRVI